MIVLSPQSNKKSSPWQKPAGHTVIPYLLQTTHMKHETRPLNREERLAALESGIAVHYLIRKLDSLKATSIYRQKLKASLKTLLTELEAHARDNVWTGEV